MAVVRISGPGDPRVLDYRDIGDHERLRARGLFVGEGRLVVQRLIDGARFPLQSLLVNPAAFQALESRIETLPAEVPVLVCAADDFKTLTGYDLHRGCLALAARPDATPIEELLTRARSIVALEDLADPDNVGSN